MTDIALGWRLGGRTGWQVCGTELAKALARMGVAVHVPEGVDGPYLAPWDVQLLQPLLTRKPDPEAVRISPLGNDLLPEPKEGSVGLVFLENPVLTPEAVARGKRCEALLAGSTWVQSVLRDHGLASTVMLQGVDRALFCPGPKPPLLGEVKGPVIFSGGKLEYRKGQDRVIRAFKSLLEREPGAILLTCWGNGWKFSLDTIGEAWLGVPRSTDSMDLTVWLAGLGIPAANQCHLSSLPHHTLPYYLRLADQAWFPNRCEGGTNLPAMECLAMGMPTWLSPGHGHDDLRGMGAEWLPEGEEDTVKALTTEPRGSRLVGRNLPTWDEAARVLLEAAR